jgi:membrane protein
VTAGDVADGARRGAVLEVADFKQAVLRFIEDAMTHHAAALTYYSLLSLFPALLFGVAVLGMVGESRLIAEAADYLRTAGAPEETIDTVTEALDTGVSQHGSAVGAVSLALILAASIWGAAAAFGAAGTALNVVLRTKEGRGIVHRKLTDIAWTVGVLLLVSATFLMIFLGGDLASEVFGFLGLGETAQQVWRFVRWPAAVACTLLVYAITYYAAPHVANRRFKWISPGALVGIGLWLVFSGGFFLWVDSFARYSVVYGAFAATVMLLIWIWLTNVALLLGAELNAAIDRRRHACEPQSSVSASAPEVEEEEPEPAGDEPAQSPASRPDSEPAPVS